jgi:hypothetical protein
MRTEIVMHLSGARNSRQRRNQVIMTTCHTSAFMGGNTGTAQFSASESGQLSFYAQRK